MITDISQNIAMDNPTFPGHLRTVIWEHLSMEETIKLGLTKEPYCYRVTGFMMCDHTSTHVDSINHIVPTPGARPVDELPLSWSAAPAVWFDFSHKPPNSYITVDDVKKAIDLTGVTIQQTSVVLYYTGWSKKWTSPWEYICDYPGVDRGAMEYLADQGVICVGADAPSIDSYAEVKTVRIQPAHIVCREREILNIENLGRVDRVPKHEFFFMGMPLRIKQGSGSPIRAIAITEK
jgi:kynurenine formamidase